MRVQGHRPCADHTVHQQGGTHEEAGARPEGGKYMSERTVDGDAVMARQPHDRDQNGCLAVRGLVSAPGIEPVQITRRRSGSYDVPAKGVNRAALLTAVPIPVWAARTRPRRASGPAPCRSPAAARPLAGTAAGCPAAPRPTPGPPARP
jgi:hypothetical protein